MKTLGVIAAFMLVFPPHASQAQETGISCLTMPSELNGYRVTQTKVYPDSAYGTSYTLANGSTDRVIVSIYPIPVSDRDAGDMRKVVAAEGEQFKSLFPYGVERRWWQTYTIMFGEPDSVAVMGEQIPGYLVAGGTRRGSSVNVEFQYLFAVCRQFVKIRATLDADTWTKSKFPTFAKDLAAYLRQH